jgi:hypothetical protein
MDLQKTDIVDYAAPMIRMEQMLKRTHDLCLDRKYEEARDAAIELGAEARMLQHVLKLMDEKEKALYGNTKADQSRQEAVHHKPARQAEEAIHGW